MQSSVVDTPLAWPAQSVEADEKKPDISYMDGRVPSYSPVSLSGAPYGTDWGQNTSNVTNGNGKRPREEPGSYAFGGEMALATEIGFVVDSGNDPTVYGKSCIAIRPTHFFLNKTQLLENP